MAEDGSLQLAGAVFDAGSVVQKEFAGRDGDGELEGVFGEAGFDVALQLLDLLVEDDAEGFDGEGLIGDDRVDPVHEFGRELAAYRA